MALVVAFCPNGEHYHKCIYKHEDPGKFYGLVNCVHSTSQKPNYSYLIKLLTIHGRVLFWSEMI